MHLRSLVLGCLVGLSITVAAPGALADDATTTFTPTLQGSTPTHRPLTDTAFGQVFIYAGSSLPAGTKPVSFQFLFDLTNAGNTSGYITPLLFEYQSVEAATVYTVVGIGRGFEVKLGPAPQVIPFNVVEGIKLTTSGNFTFGFVNSLLNASGVPILTSQGVIDFDTPSDAGQGAGGSLTTNDWLWTTNSTAGPSNIALGTTFGLANADYVMGVPYRTYAAQVSGIVVTQ